MLVPLMVLKFQSTRPSRGETFPSWVSCHLSLFQSTRPSRGETGRCGPCGRSHHNFNPLAPRGARLVDDYHPVTSLQISIHSPLAGRDTEGHREELHFRYFNPLAPRGARPNQNGDLLDVLSISIHSPLAGRDIAELNMKSDATAFQSTRPSRGETTGKSRKRTA